MSKEATKRAFMAAVEIYSPYASNPDADRVFDEWYASQIDATCRNSRNQAAYADVWH